jgi:hypothetical protein
MQIDAEKILRAAAEPCFDHPSESHLFGSLSRKGVVDAE